MKNKILILILILTVSTSMLIFKPLPVKATTFTYNISSPFSYIAVAISPDPQFTNYNIYFYGGIFTDITTSTIWTHDLDINMSFYNFDTHSFVGSYSLNIHTASESRISDYGAWTTIYNDGNGYYWAFTVNKSDIPLILGKKYSFTISIQGYTYGYELDDFYGINWNINMDAYFLLTNTSQELIPLNSRDVSLSFQSYNCDTHVATFNVNVEGYNSVEFAMVSTQKVMGKEYVISHTYDSVNKILKVYFTSDLPTGNITLSLGITVDNTMSLLKDISFTNSCSVQQTIQPGKLYITSPPAEVKYDSPQAGGDYYYISFSFAYGGSVIHDFGSDWGLANSFIGSIFVSPAKVNGGTLYSLIGVGPSEIDVMFQDGYTYKLPSTIEWTYDSTHNVSYLTVNIPLIKDYQPGMNADITIGFDLSGNKLLIHSENTVHIIIGQAITSTGNPILDFLIKTWNEFKNWFIEVMKFLFVPDSSQISQQLQTGWIDIKNTQLLPNVSSSRYLTVKMPKELFGDNDTVQIDFGKMTEWSGWSNIKTITRGLVWLVFVYILIGMVT